MIHVDNIPWDEMPPPTRMHVCYPHTVSAETALIVARCPCGGYRIDRQGPWHDRNLRVTGVNWERFFNVSMFAAGGMALYAAMIALIEQNWVSASLSFTMGLACMVRAIYVERYSR